MKDIKAHEERVQGIAKLLKSRREQEEKKEGKKNSLVSNSLNAVEVYL